MGRRCTICDHPQREAIDALLAEQNAYRRIAHVYRCSPDALLRHKKGHVTVAAPAIVETDDLVAQVLALKGKAERILDRAEAADKPMVALRAVAELRELTKLLGSLVGLLSQRNTVRVEELHIHHEWQQIQQVIIGALAPHPEARQAVLQALVDLEPPNGAS